MYESYFRLSHRPFGAAPHADAYIPTGPLEHARQTLVRCLDRAEGPGLLVGPAGTGKSLLCQLLANHFQNRFQVALLSSARVCTRRALLQNVLFELKLPYRDMDEGELRLSLIDHLEPRSDGSEGLLLLVDEAHTLPLRLLEEIRLLTNLVREGQSRVRLVLAGGMALEERLTNPKLESFHQRIAARCYLQPLGRDETLFYVQEQIRRCGGSADSLLTGDAQTAVYTATDGIPRLINQVCDHALMLAALGGHRQLGLAAIEEAWADLQQLPLPLHESPVLAGAESGSAGSVVEFGQLGDESPVIAGAIKRSVAEAAAARLDAIDRGIEAIATGELPRVVASGSAGEEFSPVTASGTEVELTFHEAHDLFGGEWEEEEVVIDRYALLEDAALRNRHRVTSIEGRAMGAAIKAALEPREPVASSPDEPYVTPAAHPGDDADENAPATIAASADFHPALDPLLPDEGRPPARSRRATIALGELGHDDRDIIVLDDDPQQPAPPVGRSRRPEYRQLFSSLRNK